MENNKKKHTTQNTFLRQLLELLIWKHLLSGRKASLWDLCQIKTVNRKHF